MNTIAKILLYLAKALNAWFIIIPINFNIFAFLAYLGVLYFSYGTVDMGEVRRIVGDGSLMHSFLAIFICIPALISFFSFIAPDDLEVGNDINGSLNSAIAHRNMMMSGASPKEAYNIMKKTGHLDMMNNGGSAFKNAKLGFDATVGNNGPASIYKDLMD